MSLNQALAEIAQLSPSKKIQYTQIAEKYGVERSTLSRRHRGVTRSRDATDEDRQNLNPQQEKDLVKYIEQLNKQRLPPTRDMIQNFASGVAQKRVSDSWVTRFINKYSDQLTSQWNSAMDSLRHNADSAEKYRLYFELLQWKSLSIRLKLDTHTIWMRKAS
ncbi:hypothetical protein EJ07DRAFT_97400 [Lizonia empirigonia]|nr:hypothetical protein EJ07DRAFT_97400 [Lizonia empirigonia]